ncbi:MAG: flagellar motor protein MotB, partial [Solirubrobacteraceae bacterium]
RGLVIRVITDDVLFPSGSATLAPAGRALLNDIAGVLRLDTAHPIAVDGHTDAVPIATSRFASNWELSAGRATEVVRHLVGRSISASRFSATGYGEQRPRATNATDAGRRANRRVEIALTRLQTPTT